MQFEYGLPIHPTHNRLYLNSMSNYTGYCAFDFVFGNSHLVDAIMCFLTPKDQRCVVTFVAEAGYSEVAKDLVLFRPKLYNADCTLCPIIRADKKMGIPQDAGVCKRYTRIFTNDYWCHFNVENYIGPIKPKSERISMLEYFEHLTQDDLDDLTTLARLKMFVPDHIRYLNNPYEILTLQFNIRPVREVVYFLRNLYVGKLMPLTANQRVRIENDVCRPNQKMHYERVNADEVVGVDLVNLTDTQLKAIVHCHFHFPNRGHGDRFQRFEILYHTTVGHSISLRIINRLHWIWYDMLKRRLFEENNTVYDIYSILAILRNHYTRYWPYQCLGLFDRICGKNGVWTRSIEELDAVVNAL